VKTSSRILERKRIVIRGLDFMLIETSSGCHGASGDIFVLRRLSDGRYHEQFSGFRSFFDAEEFLRFSPDVAAWAGFNDAKQVPPPKDRPIEALGYYTWHQPAGEDEEGIFSECCGQDPFSGVVRWLVLEGWAGWVWCDSGLVVSCGIDDKVRISHWKELERVDACK
jgi:hypothetical protein